MRLVRTFVLPLFLFCILLFANAAIAQNWPMLNYCKERTSWASDETVLHPPLEKKTEYITTIPAPSISDMSFFNNFLTLAIQGDPNTLEVFDISAGDTAWIFKLPGSRGSMSFTCAQNDSLIFAGGQYGEGLYALDRETGRQRWFKPIGPLFTRNVILDSTRAYILGDSLYCLNIENGATIWTYKLNLQSTPAVDNSYVYVVGDRKIRIFDKNTGELLWSRYTSPTTSGAITVDESNFYTFSNDTVFAFHKKNQRIKWFYQRPNDTLQVNSQNSFAITNDKLCFTIGRNKKESKGQLVTVEKETGEFIWEQTFNCDFLFAPAIANNVVYLVSGERALYGFDLETGEQLFYDKSISYKGQPIVANHKLFVASTYKVVVFGNTETKVDNENQQLTEGFRLLQNHPNPFNNQTIINFGIPQSEHVTLTIYNYLGQKVTTLANRRFSAGLHQVKFTGDALPGGLYFYKINAGPFTATRKLVLLK